MSKVLREMKSFSLFFRSNCDNRSRHYDEWEIDLINYLCLLISDYELLWTCGSRHVIIKLTRFNLPQRSAPSSHVRHETHARGIHCAPLSRA